MLNYHRVVGLLMRKRIWKARESSLWWSLKPYRSTAKHATHPIEFQGFYHGCIIVISQLTVLITMVHGHHVCSTQNPLGKPQLHPRKLQPQLQCDFGVRSAKPAADRLTLRTSWAMSWCRPAVSTFNGIHRDSTGFNGIQQVPPENQHRPGNCMKIPGLSMFSVKMNENDTSKAQLMAGSMLVGGMVNIFQNHGNFDVLHGPSCFHLDRNNLRSDFGSLFFGGSSLDLTCVCSRLWIFGSNPTSKEQQASHNLHADSDAYLISSTCPSATATLQTFQQAIHECRQYIVSVYCRPFSWKTRHIPLRKWSSVNPLKSGHSDQSWTVSNLLIFTSLYLTIKHTTTSWMVETYWKLPETWYIPSRIW